VFNTLQLQNNRLLNNQIDSITTVKLDTFILDRQRDLALKSKPTQIKLAAQTLLVGGFEEARAKRTMHLNRGSNDLLRELLMKKFAPCLRVSVVNHVCSTPTLNSGTSGFSDAASIACVMAWRVSMGSMILSIHKRAAP